MQSYLAYGEMTLNFARSVHISSPRIPFYGSSIYQIDL